MRMFIETLIPYIIIGAAFGTIDIIVTKTKIFKKFRDLIKLWSSFWGELFQCPICLGTWLSFFGIFIIGKYILYFKFYPVTLLVSWFFLDFVVCTSAGILFKLYKDKDK